MKNLWPDAFPENDRPAAKNVIEEQSHLLSKLTNGIVYASVSPLAEFDAKVTSMDNDFAFRFDIFGKFLPSYRFSVLTFSHDITLYPVKFHLDEGIGDELGLKKSLVGGYVTQIDNPDALDSFLASVLATKRLKSVIGSIIRLSK